MLPSRSQALFNDRTVWESFLFLANERTVWHLRSKVDPFYPTWDLLLLWEKFIFLDVFPQHSCELRCCQVISRCIFDLCFDVRKTWPLCKPHGDLYMKFQCFQPGGNEGSRSLNIYRQYFLLYQGSAQRDKTFKGSCSVKTQRERW